jgi:hypothetical protein
LNRYLFIYLLREFSPSSLSFGYFKFISTAAATKFVLMKKEQQEEARDNNNNEYNE